MRTHFFFLVVFMILFSGGCSPLKESRSSWVSFQAGGNIGGIVENTDLTLLPGTPVDAYTGASRTGVNLSMSYHHPIHKIEVETGIEMMTHPMTLTYNDPVNQFFGTRSISLTQIQIPFRVGAGFFSGTLPQGRFRIALGPLLQYNLTDVSGQGESLPSYSIHTFSAGLSLQFTVMPFAFRKGSSMGFYLGGYRGSLIYEDFYNHPDFQSAGSSYLKLGLVYNLPFRTF